MKYEENEEAEYNGAEAEQDKATPEDDTNLLPPEESVSKPVKKKRKVSNSKSKGKVIKKKVVKKKIVDFETRMITKYAENPALQAIESKYVDRLPAKLLTETHLK